MALKKFIKTHKEIKDKVVEMSLVELDSLFSFVDEDAQTILSKAQLYIFTCPLIEGFLTMYLKLTRLFEKCSKFPEIVQKYINLTLVSVVKEMIQNPKELYQLLETFPEKSESFLLTMTRVMLEDPTLPTKELLKTSFLTHNLDFNFMLLIIDDLTSEELLQNIDKLVQFAKDTNLELLKLVIKKLCTIDLKTESTIPKITPSEFLLRVHLLKLDVLKIKKTIECCFELKSVFNEENMAIFLTKCADYELPILYMRTLIKASQTFPKLVGFSNRLLTSIQVKLFRDEICFGGVIRYCTLNFPGCLSFLLDLEQKRAIDIVRGSLVLKEKMEKYLDEADGKGREVGMIKTLLEASFAVSAGN
jgi:hypothetical protein